MVNIAFTVFSRFVRVVPLKRFSQSASIPGKGRYTRTYYRYFSFVDNRQRELNSRQSFANSARRIE